MLGNSALYKILETETKINERLISNMSHARSQVSITMLGANMVSRADLRIKAHIIKGKA